MGGAIDWQALPFLIDLHQVDDAERLIAELTTIREYVRERDKNG